VGGTTERSPISGGCKEDRGSPSSRSLMSLRCVFSVCRVCVGMMRSTHHIVLVLHSMSISVVVYSLLYPLLYIILCAMLCLRITSYILAISYIHHAYQYIHHAYHTPYMPPSLSLCEESLIRAICVSTSITYVYARVLSLCVCVGYICVAFACARVAPLCV
jgi:hypothetical protein